MTSTELAESVDGAVSRAYCAVSEEHQRDPHTVGISQLDGCARRTAYALSKTPPTDTPEPAENCAANNGTAIHTMLLGRIAEQLDEEHGPVFVEPRIALNAAGRQFFGHPDIITYEGVIDVKTVREYRIADAARIGILPAYRTQIDAYALAARQTGAFDPKWKGIIYIDRSSGERLTVTEPVTDADHINVINRVSALTFLAADPDAAPMVNSRGPIRTLGMSYSPCDHCPWLRRCMGPDATPGDATSAKTDRGDAEIAALLTEYRDVTERERGLRADKERLSALLAGVEPGRYGDSVIRRGEPTTAGDPWAALAMVKDLGLPVPQRTQKGRTTVTAYREPKQRKKRQSS